MASKTDATSRDATFETVYRKLHGLAPCERHRLGTQGHTHTTALVREARPDRCKRDDSQAIGDFHAYAARAMRNRLIDAARQRVAARRGG